MVCRGIEKPRTLQTGISNVKNVKKYLDLAKYLCQK